MLKGCIFKQFRTNSVCGYAKKRGGETTREKTWKIFFKICLKFKREVTKVLITTLYCYILCKIYKLFCSVYIHQVRGYGRTLAVTTLFTADVQNNFNADDCPADIVDKEYTMADINFLWTYKKGIGN